MLTKGQSQGCGRRAPPPRLTPYPHPYPHAHAPADLQASLVRVRVRRLGLRLGLGRTLRTLTNKAAASRSALATVDRRWSAQPTAAKLLTSACDEGIPGSVNGAPSGRLSLMSSLSVP